MIVEPAVAEPRMRLARSFTQRKLGSSWNPIHIRSAATAAGVASAESMQNTRSRTLRLTGISLESMR
jgi:hypothetical protein